ncbi:DUF1206 domain-containing protein [Paractinoplanes rishiriensis]|uniref:DUF1206 domain-containing protein n=1 Tax=Paractinoplanes rishiriensis TaxID=1050105 RepID=A0A919JXE8_9ACTN|nr:DUF1206 domain-containing protein [Actinoplanes rishiriensis]GIE92726.1 hypothetical protein Ari01nite_01910 [Actinoplanes rishiriensis]
MSSATSNVKHTASRAADSKPLEYVARTGFVGYGIIHLLFAWIAFQVAFQGSGQDTDQSGALHTIARAPFGKFLLIVIAVGLAGMAIWQAFEAAIGESGPRDRQAMFERVLSGFRAILYIWFAWTAYKVIQGANASFADSEQKKSAALMESTGGRWLVALIGLVVVGVGIGILWYGYQKKFVKHLNTHEMTQSVRTNTVRLGRAGYMAKGAAYGIAGILLVFAAIDYDPEKARGLDAALKTLAGHAYGVWLLALIGLGIAAFGVYCFAQAKYRKV